VARAVWPLSGVPQEGAASPAERRTGEASGTPAKCAEALGGEGIIKEQKMTKASGSHLYTQECLLPHRSSRKAGIS